MRRGRRSDKCDHGDGGERPTRSVTGSQRSGSLETVRFKLPATTGSRGPRRYGKAALLATTLIGLLSVFPAAASAWVFTDIVDFNLTQSTVTYGNYSISSGGDGSASYRWLDVPAKTTVISGNNCIDGSALSTPRTIPAGDVAYYGLFGGASVGTCFLLRGRVATGQGSMTYYDGRIRR